MTTHVDVAIIGAGPGGTPAAMQLASQGKTVLLVEASGKPGGACLFFGCIPSKIIRHQAETVAIERSHKGKDAWSQEDRQEAWDRARATMDTILKKRSDGAVQMLKQMPNLTLLAGQASFISANELQIREKKTGDKKNYTFDKALIATGSHSFVPSFTGDGVKDVLTSESLVHLESLPESLLIVGGGPIGVELGQMLSILGVKCTIIEMMDTILEGVAEPEFSSIINDSLKKSGIDIYTGARVSSINKSGSNANVGFTDKDGREYSEIFEKVLIATGKIPNIESLGLDTLGITCDNKGIQVNDFMETSVSGIYAVGDVITGPKFAHMATHEAQIAAANMLQGNTLKVNFDKNTWVLFSNPEIATAGLTQAQAVKAGHDVVCGVYDYTIDAAAQVTNTNSGFLKYVVDQKTKEILGVHICHARASSLAGEAALIIARRMTLRDMARVIHPHPTLTESFGFLAQKMLLSKV